MEGEGHVNSKRPSNPKKESVNAAVELGPHLRGEVGQKKTKKTLAGD